MPPDGFAAARLWAVTRMPYLASALFACRLQHVDGSGTVSIDRGWRVSADPEVAATLPVADYGRLLIHLVSHLLREHPDRADRLRVTGEKRTWWQQCADAEVNDDLAAAGLLPPVASTVPADIEHSPGQLAETYYAHPPEEPSGNGPSDGDRPAWDCGSGADGQERPWDQPGGDGLTPGQAELLRQTTAAAIQQQEQRQRGTVPDGWVRWAEAVMPSHTNWRRVLAAEIRGAISSVAGNVDYTYRRVSRRTSAMPGPHRVVLPSLRRPMPTVAIVCDTSGSMGEDDLATVLAEIEGLLRRTGLRSTGVTVLAVDADVHAVTRARSAGQVRLAGGGGTDMAAGIAAAAAMRPRPDIVVVLTDGWTPWPAAAPPGIRVIVGVIGDRDAALSAATEIPPWARVVVIARDDISR